MIKEYLEQIRAVANIINMNDIKAATNAIHSALRYDNTVYVIGNGGSASTASHFACDLKKATSNILRIISLTDNIPIITACANDYDYESIFINQLKGTLNEGDIVVAFSGSGMSSNVLKAIDYASKNNATTIGITGYDGGKLQQMCNLGIHVPINDMQISEDFHLIITHIIMKELQGLI